MSRNLQLRVKEDMRAVYRSNFAATCEGPLHGCPPAPRIFLLACLSSCWKSSAGRTPTRQRATFASKVMRSPARRAYLPKRSSQKIHHLAAQSSRAHRPDGANFPPSFFFRAQQASAGGGGVAQAKAPGRLRAWPRCGPWEGLAGPISQ